MKIVLAGRFEDSSILVAVVALVVPVRVFSPDWHCFLFKDKRLPPFETADDLDGEIGDGDD